jgi:hypothetical protein
VQDKHFETDWMRDIRMTEQQDFGDLNAKLRANPRFCPSCGGARLRRLDEGATFVGKRRCFDCGCMWEPPWSRFTLWSVTIITIVGVAFGAWMSYTQVPDIISGDVLRQMAAESGYKDKLLHVMGPVILLGALYGFYVCIKVFRGKKGAGYVLHEGTSGQAGD